MKLKKKKILKRPNLKGPKRRMYNKKIQAKVMKAREKGLTWKEIASKLGIPSGSVHSIARRSYA